MSGNRYFLDTNAIVQLLAGNNELVRLLADAEYVGTSVVCELEFLAFSGLSASDKILLERLLERIHVTDLMHGNSELKKKISGLRASKALKLPDAIIAASSIQASCTLVTADQRLLDCSNVETLGYTIR